MTTPAKLLKQCRDKLAETQRILSVLEETVAEIDYREAALPAKRPAEVAPVKAVAEAAPVVPPVLSPPDAPDLP
jgi:hypothetical protein